MEDEKTNEENHIKNIQVLNTIFEGLISDASDLVKDLSWGVKTYLFFGLISILFGIQELIYNIDLSKPIPHKLKEKAQICKEFGVKIRSFNRLHTQKELNWWINLFLQTFNGHWGYVPVSEEEVLSRFGIKQLRWFVDSKLFLVAEHNGSPIAYLWATPDYNQVFQKMNGKLGPYQIFQFLWNKQQINQGKLHFIGIKKDFRSKNIGSYLNYEALLEMKKRGYNSAKVGLIDEENTVAHKTIGITNAKVYRKYRVFEKYIEKS